MTCLSRSATVVGSALLFVSPALALAQSVEIDHKAVGCIVVGKYPKMSSCSHPRRASRGRASTSGPKAFRAGTTWT